MLLRAPDASDGLVVNQSVAMAPPLDVNSVYCNLLQCSHFSETSVVAGSEGELKGFVSGYLIPGRERELFVWQVMVAESARGQGLAKTMLEWLVDKINPSALETTITKNNQVSWALFSAFAQQRKAVLTDMGGYFEKDVHFAGQHETERLVRIVPRVASANL